jgi:hypothetical protein
MSEGDCSWTPDWGTSDKGLRVRTSELALEQSRQLRVLGSLLAVWDAFRTWLMNAFRNQIACEWIESH